MISKEALELKEQIMEKARERKYRYIAMTYIDNPSEMIDDSHGYEWQFVRFNDKKQVSYFETKGIEVIKL